MKIIKKKKKKNALIKYEKQNIFQKIINNIKNFFIRKNKIEKIEDFKIKNKELKEVFLENLIIPSQEEVFNNQLVDKIDFKNKKDRFFEFYYKYRRNEIKASEIPLAVLIKINKMLDEEIKVKNSNN